MQNKPAITLHKSSQIGNLNIMQLLISVTSVQEAQMALTHQVEILDLKDPNAGALGALPFDVIAEVVQYVKNQTENTTPYISATIGDAPMLPEVLVEKVERLQVTGVDYIKIGFFAADDYQSCLNALQPITQVGAKIIAVLFAENTYSAALIEAIQRAGFVGVMLDTTNKNGQTLFNYYSTIALAEFAEKVIKNDMMLGFAGSLKAQDVVKLKALNPTYLGFRGGVCDNFQRQSSLNSENIRLVQNAMEFCCIKPTN